MLRRFSNFQKERANGNKPLLCAPFQTTVLNQKTHTTQHAQSSKHQSYDVHSCRKGFGT